MTARRSHSRNASNAHRRTRPTNLLASVSLRPTSLLASVSLRPMNLLASVSLRPVNLLALLGLRLENRCATNGTISARSSPFPMSTTMRGRAPIATTP
jgi:hypothetical protein